jgi:hypothetical protein
MPDVPETIHAPVLVPRSLDRSSSYMTWRYAAHGFTTSTQSSPRTLLVVLSGDGEEEVLGRGRQHAALVEAQHQALQLCTTTDAHTHIHHMHIHRRMSDYTS